MRQFGNPVRGRIGWLGEPDPDSAFVVTRGFGNKDFPQFGDHDGLDIDNGGPSGDPILAMDAGVVTHRYQDNYGALVVRIKHPDGWSTGYAHLDRFDVVLGQNVAKGQQIGTLGSSGYVTGPHLHFDTEDGTGTRQDPWPLLEQNAAPPPTIPGTEASMLLVTQASTGYMWLFETTGAGGRRTLIATEDAKSWKQSGLPMVSLSDEGFGRLAQDRTKYQ